MRQISVAGSLAYVGETTGASGALSVIDLRGAPRRVGQLALPGSVLGMARAGSMVYLGLAAV